MTDLPFDAWRWSIVPGPDAPDDGTLVSTELHDLAELDAEALATRTASLPGATVTRGVSLWDWRCTIRRGPAELVLAMTLMGDETLWGGFTVEACTHAWLLAEVAEELAASFPGTWLHADDCSLWRPDRFRATWCDPPR